jgi:hypothetical protein
MFASFGVRSGLREAARTLWPAAAKAELTARPMKPEEPVTNIRNDMFDPGRFKGRPEFQERLIRAN